MLDGLKGYVALVGGLTEATAAKAREVATALLAQGGVQGVPAGASAMATQIAGLAEDLLVTARDNRGVLMEVVRAEAERAVTSLGVITAAEADALRKRISDLEAELASERARPLPTSRPVATTAKRPTPAATKAAPATKTAATKTAATTKSLRPTKTATAKKAPAKKAAVRKPAANRTATTTTATKKAAAKKTATRKTAAKRPASNRTTSTRTTPGDRTGE